MYLDNSSLVAFVSASFSYIFELQEVAESIVTSRAKTELEC